MPRSRSKMAVAALEGNNIPQQYIIPVPTVYQEMPETTDPGEAPAAGVAQRVRGHLRGLQRLP